jgi:hypothetical protein
VSIRDHTWNGGDIAGWFTYRRAGGPTDAMVAAVVSTGKRGARLDILLKSLMSPTLDLDYALFDSTILECGLPRTIAAGRF